MKKSIYAFFIITLSLIYSCINCEQIPPAPCGASIDRPLVDLVVVMDQSQSMESIAQLVSDAASVAIDNSGQICLTDLRVTYLGVSTAVFTNTVFLESHNDYLVNIGISINDLVSMQGNNGHINERGADVANDLSNFFDWREKACRSILYISDEPVNGGTTSELGDEIIAVQNAIQSALQNNVAVFTHSIGRMPSERVQNFENLSVETNAVHYNTANPGGVSVETYLDILPEVICNSCNACRLNDFLN